MEIISTGTFYNGKYRGIRWKIVKWKTNPKSSSEMWNYYIYIRHNSLDEKGKQIFTKMRLRKFKKTNFYFYPYRLLNKYIWFHGGISWFEKRLDSTYNEIVYEIGCDYGHIGDNPETLSLETVKEDVKKTIESFLKNFDYQEVRENE